MNDKNKKIQGSINPLCLFQNNNNMSQAFKKMKQSICRHCNGFYTSLNKTLNFLKSNLIEISSKTIVLSS